MNILLYGNCQLFAIKNTLNLNNKYNFTLVECWQSVIDEKEFTNLIKNSDIIITQPISDNYRDVNYLSTSYIISQKNDNCKIIIFDSCYFNFYHFDLTYKVINGVILQKPHSYHYGELINSYKNNLSMEEYINNFVNNKELKTKEELEKIADDSIFILNNRYNEYKEKYCGNNIYTISTTNYIKENYKEKLLFYSMNHPSKYVIQYICEEIIKILNIDNTINYNIDILSNPKCILYSCISNAVNFDITKEKPLLLNINDNESIIKLYFDTYKEFDIKL